jgi:hypothetical protein
VIANSRISVSGVVSSRMSRMRKSSVRTFTAVLLENFR